MNTEITDKNAKGPRGWIFYDGNCAFCTNVARRFRLTLVARGFALAALQSRAPLPIGEPDEMRLRLADGRELGGADAVIEIARRIWWAWPLWFIAKVPGAMPLLRTIYRFIAAHRNCANGACVVRDRKPWIDLLPLGVLPVATIAIQNQLRPWVFMWALAFALFLGCKWLTWRRAQVKTSIARSLAYLFAWPGMDARKFLSGKPTMVPRLAEWIFASAKTVAGAILIWFAAENGFHLAPLLNGWIGMIGIILFLHFGAFHLLALTWQRVGINAVPLMRAPLRATSLAEFWGARWNTAFHLLAHDLLFRPLARRVGIAWAILGVFLVSGIVHDLVISLPVRGGYGLPTAYFLLQGAATLFERSAIGRAIGLGKGARGWLFMFVITAAPAFWLFHPTFVRNVILPMLQSIGAN